LLLASAALAPRSQAASAVALIAPDVAEGLGPIPANAIVVVAPLVSDVPTLKDAGALMLRVAALIAGHLGPTARVNGHSEPLSVAMAVAAKGGALIYVQGEIARGQLRVIADLYPVLSNGWDRARAPLAAPRAHAFASAPIDAEIRAFLVPIPLERAEVHKARHDLGEVLAVSCGDVDGDGGNDLVLVSRTTVAWGHIEAGRFVANHSASWTTLAPRLPVPLREPLGTAAILPKRHGVGSDIFVGTTDRGGVALSRDLRGAAPLLGLPVLVEGDVLCVKPIPSASSWEGPWLDCSKGAKALADARVELPLGRYDAVAVSELVSSDGSSLPLLATRDPAGSVRLRAGERDVTLPAAGAQVALADVDEDGIPELVTTSRDGDEALTISSWWGGELRVRSKIAAPSPLRALALCPPDDEGLRALVAATDKEVWIVR
jgi:hypothetical protein